MGGRGCGGQPWCHEVRRVTPRQVRGVVSPAALATLRKIKRAQKRRARCEEKLVILYHKKIYWVATRRENSCERHTMSWEEWRRHAYRKNRLRSGNDSDVVCTRNSWDMGKFQKGLYLGIIDCNIFILKSISRKSWNQILCPFISYH